MFDVIRKVKRLLGMQPCKAFSTTCAVHIEVVVRALAAQDRGPGFEPSDWWLFTLLYFYSNYRAEAASKSL